MRNDLRSLAALFAGLGTALTSPGQLESQVPRSGHLLVANQEAASASLIDLRTDSMRFIPVGIGPHEAAISPGGHTGVVTIYGQRPAGNELAVIDIAAGTVTRTISLGRYTRPHGVVFLPGDESRVVVTSESTGNVVIVDITSGTVEAAIPTEATGSHMAAITADGKRVFTSNVGSGSVSEIDLAGGTFVRSIPVAPRVEGIAVTPDGSLVFAGSNTDGTVSIIDTGNGTIVATLRGFKLPYRLAISADGRTAIVCDPEGGAIHAIDVATRAVAWKLEGLASPRGVSITPDGGTAFVTLADDPSVGLVDMTGRRLVRTIPVGQSPDGVGYGPTPLVPKAR
jgi:YVTN family beta-propeller protein